VNTRSTCRLLNATLPRLAVFLACLAGAAGCQLWPGKESPGPKGLFAGRHSRPAEVDSSRIAGGDLAPAESAQACRVTADKLAQQGHLREAIMLLERARSASEEPTDARKLAVLYDRSGQPGKAEARFRAALKRQPNNADLLADYGFYLYRRQQHERAEQVLRRALAIDNSHRRAWTNLGMTLARQAKYEESHAAFSKVVSPGQAYANVGAIMAQAGRRDLAQRTLRRALHLEPQLPQAVALLNHLDETQAGLALNRSDRSESEPGHFSSGATHAR